MSIEKMELVNIAGLLPDLDSVLSRCCESGCFHIETASRETSEHHGFAALYEDNPYLPVLKRLYQLAASVNFQLQQVDGVSTSSAFLPELEQHVERFEKQLLTLKETIKSLNQSIKEREEALIQISHLQGLDEDFQKIFAMTHIGVRFGKLPADSFQKLPYYEKNNFIFVQFQRDRDYYWGAYFMPVDEKQVVDDIFDALFFERVRVPDFVKGTAKDALQELTQTLEEEKRQISEQQRQLDVLLENNRDVLNQVFSRLKFLHDTFAMRSNASVLGDKFYMVGFIPAREVQKFLALFNNLERVSVVLNPPELDSRFEPPTKLKNNWFASPFSMFVEMYGLPNYNGFNPTMFVAITYTLLFGIMFGDVGQGLVLALLGLILSKIKKFPLCQIMTRVGLCSAVFGFLYGSVFGYENLLDPLYHAMGLAHKPLEVFESTNTILIGAVALGAVLILVSICINIYVGLKEKNYEKAVFGNNGIAGFIFYAAILGGMAATLLFNINVFSPVYIVILCIIPAIGMFFRIPLAKKIRSHYKHEEEGGGIGNFIAENFFELFEFVLSYVTNTMSFLRVGGFVLSHAGMMLVVMTLAETVSVGASPIVVIIGNIFVMGLEGMIVGIQVLRLEFYEIFSRFYDGNGHPFTPLKVDYESVIE